MKNQFYLLLIIGITFLSFQSKASHVVGCDISYQCTSTAGIYIVTMKIYRDCGSAALCSGCSNTIPNGTVAGCTTASSGFTTQIVGASSSCTGVNYGSFTLNADSTNNGYDLIQTCNSQNSICTNCNTRSAGTFSPGIEVFTYEGNVNLNSLPTNCCRVILGASSCCRNPDMTTMTPGNFQAVCEIDRCQIPCNTAPIFTNDAKVLVCAGVDFVYNLGAMDPDGDSLSYDFGQSLQGVGTSVAYISPFSATYPFPYFGVPGPGPPYPYTLRIDPTTGNVFFRPLGTFISQLVIEVTQWKLISGVRVNVGMTRRDVQIQTQLCLPNKVPIVKVYKNNILQPGTTFTATAGLPFCIDIVAQDQQDFTITPPIIADTTDLSWNNPGLYNSLMANATFTRNYILSQRGINGPKADSFKFCWTPPISAIRQEPYLFTASGKDRFCPIPAFATQGITVKLIAPKTIFIDSTTKNIFCNNKTITTNVNYRTSSLNLITSNIFTVQLSDSLGSFSNATNIGTKTTNDSVGFIPIIIPLGLPPNKNFQIRVNCSSDTVNLATTYPINFVAGFSMPIITSNRDSFCKGLIATFKVSPNMSGLTYKWLRNNQPIPNQTKDSLLVDSSFTYRAIVSNSVCIDTSNAKYLTVFQKPVANFTSLNSICFKEISSSINLTNTSTISTGSMTYNWLFSDNTSSNLLNPTKIVTDSGNLVVKLITTSNNNCMDSITKNIAILKAPKALFLTYDTAQCITNNYFEFWNQSLDNGLSNQYTWHFGVGNNVISNNLFRYFSYNFPGTYSVKLIALSSNNCMDTFTQIVNVVNKATAVSFTINKAAQCLKDNNFIFTNQSTPNNSSLSYKWDFGNGDTSNLTSPIYHYNAIGGTSVKLKVTANNECIDSITKNISVNAEAIADFTINNASQCLNGNSFIFTNLSTNSNNQNWSFGDASNSSNLSPTKTYINSGSFTIKLVAKNTANCNDSVTKNITVNAQAAANFTINNASQCLNGNSFIFTNLSVNSNNQTWNFGDASNSSNLSPTKSYTNSGVFAVKLLAKNTTNCNDSITKNVTINAQPIIGNINGNVAPTSISLPFTYSVSSQTNTTYNWSVTNGNIQSGQGTNTVNVVWPSIGTGSLKVKIVDNNSCTDSTNLTVNISSVGIKNLSLENDLKVYPNPTKTSITITNKTNLVGKKYIITNLVGQTVLSGKLNLDETTVNLENLQSGVYLLSIDGMNKQSIKVVKD